MGLLPCLTIGLLAAAQAAGLGSPKSVDSLNPSQQEIVDFALVQLQGGEHGPCRRQSKVEKFSQQVVAGTLYKFDLVLHHGDSLPDDCQTGEPGSEVCHMVVWDKPWEQYREVQWDQVECDREDGGEETVTAGGEHYKTPGKPLLGAGDHDMVAHGSEAPLLGGDGHDQAPHGSEAPLLGGDAHDKVAHGSPAQLLRVGLTKVQSAIRLGLRMPLVQGEQELEPQLLGSGSHDFLPHVKKAAGGLLGGDGHDQAAHGAAKVGGEAHGPIFDAEWSQKELLERGESREQLKKLQSLGAFHGFMTEHKKSYTSKEEYKKRYAVFRDNMKKVQFLKETELGTGEYGATALADLTETEFKQNYLGWKKQKDDPDVHWPAADIPDVPLPKEHDWRTLSAVTPVKNQGACGSCWAFSVTGNVEGQQAIKHGELLSLSEQELVDCDKRDSGCNGGLPENAYKTLLELGGLELESDYGYDGKDETCQYNRSSVAVRVTGGLEISQNETEMAQWLLKNGPISVGLNANAMQFYKGGVSHPWKFLCDPEGIDHGVLIVGFGEHEYPLFHKKMPYWIIKNSWGTGWGEQGFYRLFRGEGTCGINMMTSSAVVA